MAQPGLTQPQATVSQGTGSIQGVLLDASTGKPITGAFITAIRSGLPPASTVVTSGADGSFTFSTIASGTYSLCAQAPSLGYIGSCQFTNVPRQIELSAGQKSTGNSISMQAGTPVSIRIQDPKQLLSTVSLPGLATKAAPDITAGVWSRGPQGTSMFYAARLKASDAGGLDYEVLVPGNVDFALHVSSKSLALADSLGAALKGGQIQQNFQHGLASPNSRAFTYSVTGLAVSAQ